MTCTQPPPESRPAGPALQRQQRQRPVQVIGALSTWIQVLHLAQRIPSQAADSVVRQHIPVFRRQPAETGASDAPHDVEGIGFADAVPDAQVVYVLPRSDQTGETVRSPHEAVRLEPDLRGQGQSHDLHQGRKRLRLQRAGEVLEIVQIPQHGDVSRVLAIRLDDQIFVEDALAGRRGSGPAQRLADAAHEPVGAHLETQVLVCRDRRHRTTWGR